MEGVDGYGVDVDSYHPGCIDVVNRTYTQESIKCSILYGMYMYYVYVQYVHVRTCICKHGMAVCAAQRRQTGIT